MDTTSSSTFQMQHIPRASLLRNAGPGAGGRGGAGLASRPHFKAMTGGHHCQRVDSFRESFGKSSLVFRALVTEGSVRFDLLRG